MNALRNNMRGISNEFYISMNRINYWWARKSYDVVYIFLINIYIFVKILKYYSRINLEIKVRIKVFKCVFTNLPFYALNKAA